MKAITFNMKMMKTYQDNHKYLVNADAAIEKYLKLFPDNDYISIVRRHLDEVSRKLAERKLTKITGYVAGPGPTPLTEVTISLLDGKTKYVLQTARADNQGNFTARGCASVQKVNAAV